MTVTKRGRPSAASLELTAVTPRGAVERQKPPHDLTDEEVEVWSAVTGAEAADWFTPATVPLLAQYCRHVVSARRVAELIERMSSDDGLLTYDKLLQMQARESAAISSLATKMRISQQSTTNHRGNKKPTAARKLWE